MSWLLAVPLLLSVLLGLLLGVLAWGIMRLRGHPGQSGLDMHDDVLFALLILAALAFGAFIAYALLLTWH